MRPEPVPDAVRAHDAAAPPFSTRPAVRPAAPARRSYIDWLRGLAVLFMVLWHSVDAWHVSTSRDTAAFGLVGFLAGWAAPMFLLLAGVAMPMAGTSRMARGASRVEASRQLMKRGGQVFLIAHLFRAQSWVLNPNAPWDALFKPDILNILGVGMVAVGFAWRHATSPRAAATWFLLPALVVTAVLTPWIPSWTWPSLLHPRLEGYLRLANGNAVFSLFPALAYVCAGAFFGSLLQGRDRREGRLHAWSAATGLVLVVVAEIVPRLALSSEFARWTLPTVAIAGRIGAMLLLMATAWLVQTRWTPRRASPCMVFGQTSLFVYFIHIEIAYGRVSYPIHHSLALPAALAAYAVFVAALYGAARLWMRRPARAPLIPRHLVAPSWRGGPTSVDVM